jgi:hypothetical protein
MIPKQDPLALPGITSGGSPGYAEPVAPDLSTGIFRSWSPLSDAPEVANVPNLYVRRDLRTPGQGTYSLLTGCPGCNGAPLTARLTSDDIPIVAGASADFEQVLFESRLNLTGDGGGVTKVYLSDNGAVRLIGKVPPDGRLACGGGSDPDCVVPAENSGSSIAGLGAKAKYLTPNVISDDGTRVNFTAPGVNGVLDASASNLFQADSRGTASTADDRTVRVNVSERAVPDSQAAAVYETASTDGSRVFFYSQQSMTDDASVGPPHLYMWQRDHLNDETQRVTITASGGTFTLTFAGQSTGPLGAGATAAQVQAALEGLSSIGAGNVEVKEAPAHEDAPETTRYLVSFHGPHGARDLALMSADETGLTGTPTATVEPWIAGGGHLTVIDRDDEPSDNPAGVMGVIGASDDGTHVYFVAESQLVPDAGTLESNRRGIYLWHDGEITYIGSFTAGATRADWTDNMLEGASIGLPWALSSLRSRVSADGKAMLFAATNGAGLTGYDHNPTGCSPGRDIGCLEYYVYRASEDRLACASCTPSGERPTSDLIMQTAEFGSFAVNAPYLSRRLSEDGRRVFFTSREKLVPEDTNGKYDAYQYDTITDTISLLSTGKSTSDSYFLDASASGDDAFFATSERLVGWDIDNSYDFYDARVGGGLPDPITPPALCAGSSCQGPLTTSPPAATPASRTYAGAGNLTDRIKPRRHKAKKCRKGKTRRKINGKKRCVKKKHVHRKTSNRRRG